MKKLEKLDICNTDINEVDVDKLPNSLNEFKYSTKKRPNCKLTTIVHQLKEYEWKDLHFVFTHWERKGWEKAEFNKKQTKEWIQSGLEPYEYRFAGWLRDVKKITPQGFLENKNKENYQELRERCNHYDWCHKCQRPNTGYNWCQPCYQQSQQMTSGNKEVDEFIRQQQLVATDKEKVLSWIPYEQFTNIEHLADGGFGTVYKAKWGKEKDEDDNDIDKMVALKILHNSKNMTIEFLREIAKHKLFSGNRSISGVTNLSGNASNIVNCYGISQDPETKNYVMVTEYIESGNLRQYLKKKYSELSFWDKLRKLFTIVSGLNDIQHQKLIHRDFHSGNILNKGIFLSLITDFGLAKPASETDDNKIYGVLPYVAPEVLRGQPYTSASDIYSFGIIAYELLANSYPYANKDLDDTNLALAVYQGLRPNIEKLKIPQLLKNLIKKCWDADPLKRPTVGELCILHYWYSEIRDEKNTEFHQQYQAIKKEYDHWSQNTSYRIHFATITTSKQINTKLISELLKNYEQNNIPQSLEFPLTELQKELEGIKMDDNQFSQPIEFTANELNRVSWEEITEETTNWTNLNPNFTPSLITQWQNLGFAPTQTHDWLNIGLQPTDHQFAAYLRDHNHLTPEEVLNYHHLEILHQEFSTWQQQSQIQQPPK